MDGESGTDLEEIVEGGARPSVDVAGILEQTFGFSQLRPGQDRAVEALLAGRDVLAVMPTGAGKSLCFQLPAIVRGGLTVVVSPLIALMKDQVSALKLLGISAAAINSSQSREENVEIWRNAAAGDVRLLYLSPEMLMSNRMLSAMQRLKPQHFAIDEVHCMSQWGAAFRPEYADLRRLKDLFPSTVIIGLTATADPKTREDIKAQLYRGNLTEVVTGFDRPNLRILVQPKDKAKQQLSAFLGERRGQSGIVYCLSRRKTEELAEFLRAEGHQTLAFHAGLENQHRAQVQERFMSEPGLVIVATIAFGMGIDKPDIRFVAHADLPGNMEAYYQEIGRAGRDGEPADCLLLWGGNDINQRRQFITNEGASEDHERLSIQRLNALMAFVDATSCRRAVMLRYFGDATAEAIEQKGCGNCDLCLNPVETQDESAAAKQVAAAIRDTGGRFGIVHICDVLRGVDNEKVQKFRHFDLPSFGTGASRTAKQWRSLTRQMQSAGLLDIDLANYSRACITPKLNALEAGEGSFNFRPDVKQSKTVERTKPVHSGLTEIQEKLLADLKLLRRKLAKERDVPAFVIFSDKTLIDMAFKAPSNPFEFQGVHGVGAAKLESFGEIFMDAIERFQRDA